jgi:hypothetical protein
VPSCSSPPALVAFYNALHHRHPGLQFGGIYGDKPLYHNCRHNLLIENPGDPTIQAPDDRLGNPYYGSAIDLTWWNNLSLQRYYTRKLMDLTRRHDPRMFPLSQFAGSLDTTNGNDGHVTAMDVRSATFETGWDTSHLWHIHMSWYRRWNNAHNAVNGVLDAMLGKDVNDPPGGGGDPGGGGGGGPSDNPPDVEGFFAADVSQYQTVAVNDDYNRPWLIFRVGDPIQGYVDHTFIENWSWSRGSGMVGWYIYEVYRPGMQNFEFIKDAVENRAGGIPRNFAVLIDVERWAGTANEIHGDHSAGINRLADQLANWLGDRRRVLLYGNVSDLESICPDRHNWLKIHVAGWGAQKPKISHQLGWQYTNGTKNNPVIQGWPRSSEPFGTCDHNHWDGGPHDLADLLGFTDPVGPPRPPPPDTGPDPVLPEKPLPVPADQPRRRSGVGGNLGCGTHQAWIFDRGGQHKIGEIEPVTSVTWNRVRDDISTAQVVTSGFGSDCCDLMSDIHSMRHELVIFRDGVRCWEGPITSVAFFSDHVEISASDVMYYLFRRILREGYDDRYRRFNNPVDPSQPLIIDNIKSVVERAVLIAVQGLQRDDPNVIPFITRFDRDDDAQESRYLKPFQKTCWEEIDDMAANAGLDYTVIGRRIMFWDTHTAIGRQPVWDDDAFLANPVITEYGASLATFSVVSDTSGNYASAGGDDYYYGLVETLNSSFSSKGPSFNSKDLIKLKNTRNDACQKYHEARSNYLRYPGLTKHEADQLAAWIRERNTPGVTPERQKWLDAHIAPRKERDDKKKGLKTTMDGYKTECDNARDDMGDFRHDWDEYMKSLRAQAQRNLTGRNPAPVHVRIPDNSQLSPDLDIGISDLVPGIWIPLRSKATCKDLRQWQKLDQVNVSSTSDGGEQVTVTMSPAPGGGRNPVTTKPSGI